MSVTRARSEDGFTLIATMIGVFIVGLLAAVAVAAVNGDTHSGLRDFEQKQAYEAAKAAIDEYSYHLHVDNAYWAKCTNVSGPVNQQGASTLKKRALSGSASAEYAIELLPANGKTSCDPTSTITATASMLQSTEPMKGTFRIRAIGYYGKAKSSIVATFKPASFLDYVYFTQLETSDPVTYGPNSETIKNAETQCSKTLREGRYEARISGTSKYCDVISFVSGDEIKGPMHTNDTFAICGEPQLGRNASDPIEMSEPANETTQRAWYSTNEISHSGSSCSGSSKEFKGTEVANAPELKPPETNSQLAEIAESKFKFKGQVRICLNGSTMTVGKGKTCTETSAYSGALPSNGVIYVENETCTGLYSPFQNEYENTSKCGNVYVHGTYSKPLTIAAGNNIIIDGNLTHSGEESMLGLIANNFIRIYHPRNVVTVEKCSGFGSSRRCEEVEEERCENVSSPLKNVTIEAALLAINHSFIVDNYNCGSSLGTLTVIGAIAQNYRGAVGTSGGTGFLKNYNYDERLKTIEPPSFIEPVQSDWVVGRETVG
jgi:type II secretory pathway pseudopilin PulG